MSVSPYGTFSEILLSHLPFFTKICPEIPPPFAPKNLEPFNVTSSYNFHRSPSEYLRETVSGFPQEAIRQVLLPVSLGDLVKIPTGVLLIFKSL